MNARLADCKKPARKLEKIIVRNFDFSNDQKSQTNKNAGDSKTKHKQTKIKFFRNRHKPKNDFANKTEIILQTKPT